MNGSICSQNAGVTTHRSESYFITLLFYSSARFTPSLANPRIGAPNNQDPRAASRKSLNEFDVYPRTKDALCERLGILSADCPVGIDCRCWSAVEVELGGVLTAL